MKRRTWVVIPEHDEGPDYPIAVFFSREKAIRWTEAQAVVKASEHHWEDAAWWSVVPVDSGVGELEQAEMAVMVNLVVVPDE